jgi:hypothetical protein
MGKLALARRILVDEYHVLFTPEPRWDRVRLDNLIFFVTVQVLWLNLFDRRLLSLVQERGNCDNERAARGTEAAA